MSDPLGQLVEYIDKGRLVLGLVQGVKKGRLALITAGDRLEALPEKRGLLLTPSVLAHDRPREALVAYLRQEEARREEMAAGVNVAELWELVHEESEPLPLKELAALSFSDGQSPTQLSATLRALFNEHLHFRLAGEQFVPLSAEQLEAKLAQVQREAANQAEMDSLLGYLRSLPKQPPFPEPPADLAKLLADLVIWEDAAPQAKKAKDVVTQAELGGRRQVFDLLVDLGVFQPHQSLELLKEGLAEEFPPQVLAAASGPLPVAPWGEGREDLTGLTAFTIDGTYSADFDDALSFEPDGQGGGTVGVHITDAGAIIAPGGELDMEARSRGTSVYLPDARFPMLPPSLSEDALSLRAGQARPALSCLATLDAQGRVTSWRLTRSLLKVARRYTYDEADGLLAGDSDLVGLRRLMQAFRLWRREQGAHFLPLPELVVWVDENWQVVVKRIDQEGPSREMVAETAILANWLKARHMAENGIPSLYRVQPPPREAMREGDPSDIYLHFSQRRLLNRVELTCDPGLHGMLGLSPYTHVTSPIRRYLDLVVQRQMGAALAGAPLPYDADTLRCLAQEVEPIVRRAGKLRQARQRYWLLRWLEARMDRPLPALVMELQFKRWQILITDIMMLTTIPVEAGRTLEPGQAVSIKVVKADAFYDQLRVELA
jgi:exoribonuclease-2